ncbi:hypothetical protein [Leuconostoc pseudomesenteroides]|uniref:hypothetical protein n=1 Tax=Leuconostoc pseudomesenteroides TaxID=33968 RepID=UPI00289EBC64|nr:hypothetical protein [Leuconostoc pseudomesenteroides]
MSEELASSNFQMNVYLYNNYVQSDNTHFTDFALYDKNLKTEYHTYKTYLDYINGIINDPQPLENNAKEVATLILHSIDNGTENDSIRRKTMLAKYDELRSKSDFNNPDKAPEYAEQIVDSYK